MSWSSKKARFLPAEEKAEETQRDAACLIAQVLDPATSRTDKVNCLASLGVNGDELLHDSRFVAQALDAFSRGAVKHPVHFLQFLSDVAVQPAGVRFLEAHAVDVAAMSILVSGRGMSVAEAVNGLLIVLTCSAPSFFFDADTKVRNFKLVAHVLVRAVQAITTSPDMDTEAGAAVVDLRKLAAVFRLIGDKTETSGKDLAPRSDVANVFLPVFGAFIVALARVRTKKLCGTLESALYQVLRTMFLLLEGSQGSDRAAVLNAIPDIFPVLVELCTRDASNNLSAYIRIYVLDVVWYMVNTEVAVFRSAVVSHEAMTGVTDDNLLYCGVGPATRGLVDAGFVEAVANILLQASWTLWTVKRSKVMFSFTSPVESEGQVKAAFHALHQLLNFKYGVDAAVKPECGLLTCLGRILAAEARRFDAKDVLMGSQPLAFQGEVAPVLNTLLKMLIKPRGPEGSTTNADAVKALNAIPSFVDDIRVLGTVMPQHHSLYPPLVKTLEELGYSIRGGYARVELIMDLIPTFAPPCDPAFTCQICSCGPADVEASSPASPVPIPVPVEPMCYMPCCWRLVHTSCCQQWLSASKKCPWCQQEVSQTLKKSL